MTEVQHLNLALRMLKLTDQVSMFSVTNSIYVEKRIGIKAIAKVGLVISFSNIPHLVVLMVFT